jgi:hypothetical protein
MWGRLYRNSRCSRNASTSQSTGRRYWRKSSAGWRCRCCMSCHWLCGSRPTTSYSRRWRLPPGTRGFAKHIAAQSAAMQQSNFMRTPFGKRCDFRTSERDCSDGGFEKPNRSGSPNAGCAASGQIGRANHGGAAQRVREDLQVEKMPVAAATLACRAAPLVLISGRSN